MQQLCIEYFYPLTEQIPLDLDFKPCQDYAASKYVGSVISGSGLCLTIGNGGTVGWATVINNNLGAPSFTINVDQEPITIVSKKKPNFIKRFIYKSLGMKWKSE